LGNSERGLGAKRRAGSGRGFRAALVEGYRDRRRAVCGLAGVTASKFYDWRERCGRVNEHNGWVPRDFWLEDLAVSLPTHGDSGSTTARLGSARPSRSVDRSGLLSALTPVVEALQTKRLEGWAKRFWFYFWGIALAPSGLLRAITLRRIVRSGIVADARSSLNTKAEIPRRFLELNRHLMCRC